MDIFEYWAINPDEYVRDHGRRPVFDKLIAAIKADGLKTVPRVKRAIKPSLCGRPLADWI